VQSVAPCPRSYALKQSYYTENKKILQGDKTKSEKAAGEGSLFHEGSININKGLYNVKDLGESLTHPYLIAF
jgi:hypothetical protein